MGFFLTISLPTLVGLGETADVVDGPGSWMGLRETEDVTGSWITPAELGKDEVDWWGDKDFVSPVRSSKTRA